MNRLLDWVWAQPSWVVELVAGLGLAVLVAAWPWWWVRVLLATGASVVYEAVCDRHGWSLADVRQREVGVVAPEVVRACLRLVGVVI